MSVFGKAANTAQLLQGASAKAGGKDYGTFIATAYGPPWGGIEGGGTTATGMPLPGGPTGQVGPPFVVAVDPSVIPLHTKLSIDPNPANDPSIVWAAEDTGGDIKGNRIDFLMLNGRAAQDAWGRRSVHVTSAGGAAAQGSSNQGAAQGSGGGGAAGTLDVIGILKDLLTANLGDLAVKVAMAGAIVIKDIGLGFADWVIIPTWHWNQRAVAYYQYHELGIGNKNIDKNKWTRMPWTAAFWGLGYWLFWTDPNSGLKPAPVRNSRIGRHARAMQSIPARRSLVKPKEIANKTPTKPKPMLSVARVSQTGTMRATRTLPVKVHGDYAERASRSQVPVEREQQPPLPHPERHNATKPQPNPKHRTGNRPPADR